MRLDSLHDGPMDNLPFIQFLSERIRGGLPGEFIEDTREEFRCYR